MRPLLRGHPQMMVIDPTKGALLTQLANAPTLFDRPQTGGKLRLVILFWPFWSLGLWIAIFPGKRFIQMKRKIKAQLKQPDLPVG
ncbi:hypothetical protein P4S72_22075 [Vibrio sp. PP-XX7]